MKLRLLTSAGIRRDYLFFQLCSLNVCKSIELLYFCTPFIKELNNYCNVRDC
jgi:hypothetical protein